MSTLSSITCPRCGRESFNPNDVAERYCGACHEFHENMGRAATLRSAIEAGVTIDEPQLRKLLADFGAGRPRLHSSRRDTDDE